MGVSSKVIQQLCDFSINKKFSGGQLVHNSRAQSPAKQRTQSNADKAAVLSLPASRSWGQVPFIATQVSITDSILQAVVGFVRLWLVRKVNDKNTQIVCRSIIFLHQNFVYP